MTVGTGRVDAISFLSLGRAFTTNMTGDVVLLAFATAHVSGESSRMRASVEYAIRMPGTQEEEPVLLPVNAKFPREAWERLEDTQSRVGQLSRSDGENSRTIRHERAEAGCIVPGR
jgi:hypothetical protein